VIGKALGSRISMSDSSPPLKFADGEIVLWAEEGEPIMLRSVSPHGDPVELTADEARDLAAALKRLADWCDGLGTRDDAR